MMHKPHPSEVLAGSYALNGLTDEERAEFERLLAKSESLRAEVTELQDTAVLLGAALPEVTPPDYLKVRIMAQIHNTPQLEATAVEIEQSKESFWRRVFNSRPLSAAIGAFALVAVIGLGSSVISQANPVSNSNSVVAIQQADDSRRAKVSAADVADSVTVMWSNSAHRAAVRVHNAELPANKDLQLWIVDAKGNSVDAGVMNETTGDGWYLLNGKLETGDSIAATIEPKGGSEKPTSKAVFVVSA